jgi:hypothetical protein
MLHVFSINQVKLVSCTLTTTGIKGGRKYIIARDTRVWFGAVPVSARILSHAVSVSTLSEAAFAVHGSTKANSWRVVPSAANRR